VPNWAGCLRGPGCPGQNRSWAICTTRSLTDQSYWPFPVPSISRHGKLCLTQPKPASLIRLRSRSAVSARHQRKACMPYSGDAMRVGHSTDRDAAGCVGAGAAVGWAGAGVACRPGMVSTCPTEIRFGSRIPFALASSSTVRPNLLATLKSVSPVLIVYVAGSGGGGVADGAIAICGAAAGGVSATAIVVVRSPGASVNVGRGAFVAVAAPDRLPGPMLHAVKASKNPGMSSRISFLFILACWPGRHRSASVANRWSQCPTSPARIPGQQP